MILLPRDVHIVPATSAHLTFLASKVGLEPLFQRYRLTPASLAKSWTTALARGEKMRVAVGAQGPLGLAWFTGDGAFGRGSYLRLLAVAPQTQNKGVGKMLLATFEEACSPAAGGYFLLCSDFNIRAQRFYAASGYREVGRLEDFVMPGVTEIIFQKRTTGAEAGRGLDVLNSPG